MWDLGMHLLGAIPKKNPGELYVPLSWSTKLCTALGKNSVNSVQLCTALNGCPAPGDAHLTESIPPKKAACLLAAVLPWEKLLGNKVLRGRNHGRHFSCNYLESA